MVASTPRRPSAVLVVALAAVAVLALCLAAALVLLARDDEPTPTSAPSTPSAPQRLSATGIVTTLARHGLVDAESCKAEAAAPPATSQDRCEVGGGKELITIGFPDGSGVRERLAGWLGGGALVRGPNWLVNVRDLDAAKREEIRAALNGTLVNLPG
ncbi:hypothetical protein [Actinomadura litoris]|uniref:Uncharacterized protein n=1 Tax=Actinomadura litoris TaxID=2678616 RepID=A0A7K1L3J7_9ACTN|nr:hypothetical protein [Actinomadura litoris]MUN38992.1 hypothetical protein [Actinomadura litoris]